jgi:outer membrane immunogenic protein
MKLKYLFLAAAAVIAGPQVGLAADLPVKAAPAATVAPVANWTGLYVGAGLGYGLFDVESRSTVPGVGGGVFPNGDAGGRGWLGTLQVGYDAQLSNFVVGVFGDYDWSRIKGTLADQGSGNNFSLEQKSAWSVGGRIGYLVTPQFLTYFSGGYTEANFRGSTGVCASGGGACGVGFLPTVPSHTYSGYFLGGGTEYALSWFGPGWTVKTEYRLADYSSDTFAATGPGVVAGTTATMRPFVQTVRSELTYKFNWGR